MSVCLCNVYTNPQFWVNLLHFLAVGSFWWGSGHRGVRGRVRAPGAKPRGWRSFLRHKIGITGQGDHPIGTIFCKWVAFDEGQVIAGLGLEAEPQGQSPGGGGSFFRHKIGSTGHGNHPIVAIFCKWVAFNKGQVIAGLGVGAEPHGWSPEGGSFSRHKMSSTGQGNHPIVAIFCKWVIDLVYIYIYF